MSYVVTIDVDGMRIKAKIDTVGIAVTKLPNIARKFFGFLIDEHFTLERFEITKED